jgi:hypothetical protein
MALKFGNITRLKSKDGFEKWLSDHNITNIPPSALGHIQLGKIADKTSFDKIKQSVKIVTIKLE